MLHDIGAWKQNCLLKISIFLTFKCLPICTLSVVFFQY